MLRTIAAQRWGNWFSEYIVHDTWQHYPGLWGNRYDERQAFWTEYDHLRERYLKLGFSASDAPPITDETVAKEHPTDHPLENFVSGVGKTLSDTVSTIGKVTVIEVAAFIGFQIYQSSRKPAATR